MTTPRTKTPAKDAPTTGAPLKDASGKGASGKGASGKSVPTKGAPGKGPRAKGPKARETAASAVARGFRVPRLRLLPFVIFTAVLMLSVRLGGLWQNMAVTMASLDVGRSQAQAQVAGGNPAPAVTRLQPPVEPPGAATGGAQLAASGGGAEGGGETPEGVNFGAPSSGGVDPLKDPVNFTQSEIDLLQKLAERRELIETRAQELEQREALLTAAEGRIDRKISDLQTLRTTLEGLLKRHDEQEEAKIGQLVKIYATMKPKDAARIFNELDMPILLTVLENMKESSSAPILAAMDAGKARAVTEEMSQRRKIPLPDGAPGG
jgi:flagellar motility protein MotE (MotC chaperone)